MARNYYSELTSVLKGQYRKRLMPLFRSEEEVLFLRDWLEKDQVPLRMEPVTGKTYSRSSDELRSLVESCALCGATEERKYGYGDGSSGVMIILNSPRLISQVEIRLYRRESVEMIRKMVEAMNLAPARCYITNLVKCESSDRLVSPGQMMQNCLSVISQEMAVINPKIIIVMGEIQPLQKIVHGSSGVFWYTIEHPVTLLKNTELKRTAWATLKNVMGKIQELGLS
ncbi:MAG: hypothetical protein CVV44_12740 [Spirochaetae bacterium HGW-Spirochaetae-1]|jgi:uracil-DNA glycosylase family 4|nr:MAG: hypothetical protein CVV44_12740 [Spirochaetae bacterium HGW-Spirochaetae-1]